MMTAETDRSRPAVVLVSDRTLSGDYRVLFEGIFATMQTTSTPGFIMRRLLSRRVGVDADGRADAAVLGLRRVEASLLAETSLTEADIAVTTAESLGKLLGPWTRVVGVSSGDPLGGGMSNTTTGWMCGGRLYTATWTDRMMAAIRRARDRFDFSVIGGGPGAWQWSQDPSAATGHGLDTVFEGAFEAQGPRLIEDILAGRSVSNRLCEDSTCVDRIRPIRRPSLMGALELSRGCGNGCRFCTSSTRPMAHLPPQTILADLRTNVAGGIDSVVSGSEDFFRYGSTDGRVNFPALASLLEAMQQTADLSFMQIDHANVSSVVQLDDGQLRQIRRLLTWRAASDYLWVNLGVESANGRLVAAAGAGKIAPLNPDDWAEAVEQTGEKLTRCGFFTVFSVILGLPGETPDDVAATLDLVRRLARRPCAIFPIFYVPSLAGDLSAEFTTTAMRPDHLDLFATCYEINFRRIPKLFADNQRAGGVSWFIRRLYQTLGRGEVFLWRWRLGRLKRRLLRNHGAVSTTGKTA